MILEDRVSCLGFRANRPHNDNHNYHLDPKPDTLSLLVPMLRQPFSLRLVQDLRFQAQAAWTKAISKGSEELGLQVYRFEGLGDLGLRVGFGV